MKTELIQSLTTNFEACTRQTETGIEYWLAAWVPDHFADVSKMVDLGSLRQSAQDHRCDSGKTHDKRPKSLHVGSDMYIKRPFYIHVFIG
jgi:hypothetical protein